MTSHKDEVSSKVQPIRPDVLIAEGKQQLIEKVSQSIDEMASEKLAPCFIMYCLVDADGNANTNWQAVNEAEDRMSLYIARALLCLENDVHANERASVDDADTMR